MIEGFWRGQGSASLSALLAKAVKGPSLKPGRKEGSETASTVETNKINDDDGYLLQ